MRLLKIIHRTRSIAINRLGSIIQNLSFRINQRDSTNVNQTRTKYNLWTNEKTLEHSKPITQNQSINQIINQLINPSINQSESIDQKQVIEIYQSEAANRNQDIRSIHWEATKQNGSISIKRSERSNQNQSKRINQ